IRKSAILCEERMNEISELTATVLLHMPQAVHGQEGSAVVPRQDRDMHLDPKPRSAHAANPLGRRKRIHQVVIVHEVLVEGVRGLWKAGQRYRLWQGRPFFQSVCHDAAYERATRN